MKSGTLKGFLAGVLVMGLVFSLAGGALAKTAKELITVDYCDIQIIIDGTLLTPTDVNGTPVEPFAYNGTTFLPVRAIAEAAGYDVDWTQETHTVTLTSVPGEAGSGTVCYSEISIPSLDNVLDGATYDRFQTFDGGIAYYYRTEAVTDPTAALSAYIKLLEDYGFAFVSSVIDESKNAVYTYSNSLTGVTVYLESVYDDTVSGGSSGSESSSENYKYCVKIAFGAGSSSATETAE